VARSVVVRITAVLWVVAISPRPHWTKWQTSRTWDSAWGFTVTIGGKRVRRQGYLSRTEAQEALDALKHPDPAAAPATVAALTLAEAFERYFKSKARKRSLDEDERIAKHLKAEFGEQTPLAEITASRISAYKANRLAVEKSRRGSALSAASINRPLALLRHLLRLAHEEWELLPAVPRIKLEKESQGRLRWLTPEEATKLLTKCREQKNPALVDLVELALYTGMRQGELLDLTWARVDRARGVVLLEITKSGRRREVPLNGPADAILARRAPAARGDALVFGIRSWGAFRKSWEAALEAGQLGDFHFHDLRHTFASWAVQRGVTLPELKDLLGHTTLAMVMRYAHLAPEQLRSAVSRLDDVLVPARSGKNRAEQTETLIASKS
jgi:integrase